MCCMADGHACRVRPRLETGMMISVKHPAPDVMFGLATALVCVGSVLNLIALSRAGVTLRTWPGEHGS
jgi:hypothetical protein